MRCEADKFQFTYVLMLLCSGKRSKGKRSNVKSKGLYVYGFAQNDSIDLIFNSDYSDYSVNSDNSLRSYALEKGVKENGITIRRLRKNGRLDNWTIGQKDM